MDKILSMYKEKNKAVILIYGAIGFEEENQTDTSEKKIATQLQEMGDISEIEVRINSPGGIAYSGIAIYNVLENHKATKKVYIDGLAASIASLVAMTGEDRRGRRGSTFMIHNPYTKAFGESKDLKKIVNSLEKLEESMLDIYSSKNKKISREQIRTLMREETFLTAEEALALGFLTSIDEETETIHGFNSKAIVALNKEYNKKNKEGGIMSKYKGIAEAVAKAIKESGQEKLTKGGKASILASLNKSSPEKEKHEIVAEEELSEIVAEVTQVILATFTQKEEKAKKEETLVAKVLGNLGIASKKEEPKAHMDEEVIAQAIAMAVMQAMAEKKEEEKSDFFANFSSASKREDATKLAGIENTHAKELNSEKISAELIGDIVAIANGQ